MHTYEAAVCEDRKEELNYIASSLSHSFQERHFSVHFTCYPDSRELLTVLQNRTANFNLFFLDIEMPECNGIELCRQIRQRFPESLVVFISNKEELVFQTFEVQPFRFIRKNHFSQELPLLTSAIIEKLIVGNGLMITAMELHSNRVYSWNINQIQYIEALAKQCRVVTDHGETLLQYRFKYFEAQLRTHGFLKPHRSFLVNYRFISVLEKDVIVLDSGMRIPLSRNRTDETKNEFLRYVNGDTHDI